MEIAIFCIFVRKVISATATGHFQARYAQISGFSKPTLTPYLVELLVL